MSWQEFTLVQVVVFAIAAIGAAVVRNRRLRRNNDQLLSLCTHAHTELVNVTERLSDAEPAPTPEQLLLQRARALIGDDPVLTVRRLVLENEAEPSPDFADLLSGYLKNPAADPADAAGNADGSLAEPAGADAALPPEEEFVRRWRSIREECQQLAMFLVDENPGVLPAIRQLFEVMAPLDHAYRIDLPPLDLPRTEADGDPDDSGGDAASAAGEAQPDGDDETLDQAALDALLEQAGTAEAPADAAQTGTG